MTDISPGTPDQMAVTMKSLCSTVRSFQLSAFHIGSKSATSSNGTSQPVKSWQSVVAFAAKEKEDAPKVGGNLLDNGEAREESFVYCWVIGS